MSDSVRPHRPVTNKNLLYHTGSSTQYSVMTDMGKESEKEWIYVYVYPIHLTAHLKLTQHCKSTISNKKLFKKRRKKRKNPPAMQELQETRVPSLGQEDPLEEGMTTHSSILAWRIPWTEDPGGLQATGSQRVGHD